MQNTAASKRLAKNTIFMYGRILLSMIISLFTSRVVLQQLGVDDYGIYNVVGSVVAIFNSLRGLFASSIQRCLNYESGRGDENRLRLVFSMGVNVQLIIALIFFIVVEIVGIWFLNNEINIAPSRLYAARWVFQFSVITAIISIMTIPYDAVMISRERMDVYAYVSIFEAVFKLIIVYILVVSPIDKLILYGALQLLVAIIVRVIYGAYCRTHFQESRYLRCWDKDIFKDMSHIAGWNFFGNTAYALTQNGLNMVLNVFGGPVVNAARGIAYQILSIVTQLMSNIGLVFNPYSVKAYASGDKDKMFRMLHFSSKLFFLIIMIVVIIVTFLTGSILQLWLGVVPEYTIGFVRLILVHSLLRSIHSPLNTIFLSVGNLKKYQITEGIILSVPLLLSYIGLRFGAPYEFVFISMIVMEIINYVAIIRIAKKIAELSIKEYLKQVILPCVICIFIALVAYICNETFITCVWSSIAMSIITIAAVCLYMWFCGFSLQDRQQILSIIRKK